jgi:hypothetical protein
VRLEHLAFKAMSLLLNPYISKVLIKIYVVASNGGAIIIDNTLTLDERRNVRSANFYLCFKVGWYLCVQATQAIKAYPATP